MGDDPDEEGLQVGEAEGSALAESLRQLVEIHAEGVPDRPPWTERSRNIDPDRDLVLVLTDRSAAARKWLQRHNPAQALTATPRPRRSPARNE